MCLECAFSFLPILWLLLLSLLSSSTKTENEVESGLLLDIVIRKSAAILELLSSKDKTLLIRGDSFLVLDLGLYIVDGVRRLNIECNGLACHCTEHLHDASQTFDNMASIGKS